MQNRGKSAGNHFVLMNSPFQPGFWILYQIRSITNISKLEEFEFESVQIRIPEILQPITVLETSV